MQKGKSHGDHTDLSTKFSDKWAHLQTLLDLKQRAGMELDLVWVSGPLNQTPSGEWSCRLKVPVSDALLVDANNPRRTRGYVVSEMVANDPGLVLNQVVDDMISHLGEI